ncbi:unnamed protein product [Prunus brigantina]
MSLALRGNLGFLRGKKGSVKVRKERFVGDLARKREMKNNALLELHESVHLARKANFNNLKTNNPFPRNPNGFYPFWLSFSLPFSSPPLAFPILMKFPLSIRTKSGTLGAQGPFPTAVPVGGSVLSYFSSSFHPPSLARSDEGKEVDIHAGSKGTSGSSQANIIWFLECFLLGTCSSHVLEPPAALFNKSLDLPLCGFYFSSKGLRLLWLILEFCMGQGGSLSKWAI